MFEWKGCKGEVAGSIRSKLVQIRQLLDQPITVALPLGLHEWKFVFLRQLAD